MRWKISTESRTEDKNNERRKTTKVTKTQYITVGDIVGMGKSAAGAVQKLAKDLPAFANSLKEASLSSDKRASNEATAWAINAVVQPLSVILDGMEKFRSIMRVVDMATPIVKTIARTTGIWCSPGNVGEILEVSKGIATQILIGALSSSILKLKEMIWNYEFDIREISEETSILICNLLKKFDAENENNKLDSNFLYNSNNYTENKKIEDAIASFNSQNEEINNLINESYSDDEATSDVDLGVALRMIKGKEVTDEDKAKIYDGYKTEYVTDKGFKRKLYGSLTDGGIYYSDDDGETWTKSGQETGSFACFSKILVNNKWRYLAGSTYYVQEVIKTNDKKDSDYLLDGCYKKDYYNENCVKLTKQEKNDILKETGFEYLYDKKDYKDAIGIYYSDNNGETWNQTEVTTGSYELLFEFQEKVGHPARTVASSYDYKGVLYTENGIEFKTSNFIDGRPIINGRWVFYSDFNKNIYNDINPEYFISLSNIDINNSFSVVNTSIKENFKINTKIVSKMTIGKEIDTINEETVRQILNYIHNYYSKNLEKYSNDEGFWKNLIKDINNGTYTLEDAKKGIRL